MKYNKYFNNIDTEILNEEYPIEQKDLNELFNFLRKNILIIGDYRIEYKGEDVDTINGKTETWIITRKLSLFEEGDKE